MIIKSIKAHNFMRYPEFEINDFPQKGLIGVFGDNEAGKSTIGHLISFALFGVTAKATRGEKEQIINWNAKSCDVDLVFSWKEKDYRIYRKMKQIGSPDAHIEDVSKEEVIEVGVTAVDNFIKELLTFDFKGFRYSTYVAQKELDLIQDSKKIQDRKAVINKMLGIDAIEKARKGFPAKIKELKKDKETIETKLENVSGKIKELNDKQDSFDIAKEKHEGITQELYEKEEELKGLDSLLAKFDKYKETDSNIKSKKELLPGIGTSLSKTVKEIQEIEQAKKDLTELNEQLEEFKDVDEKLNQKNNLKSQLDDFLDKLSQIKNIITEISKQNAIKQSKVEQAQKGFEENREDIDRKIKDLSSIHIDDTKIKALENSNKKDYKVFMVFSIIAFLFFITFIFLIAKNISFWFVPLIITLVIGIFAFMQKRKMVDIQDQLNQCQEDRIKLKGKDSDLEKNSEEKKQIQKRWNELSPKIELHSKLEEALKKMTFNRFSDIKVNYQLLSQNSYDELLELKDRFGQILKENYLFISSEQEIKLYKTQIDQELVELNSKVSKKIGIETDIKNKSNAVKKEQETKKYQKQLSDKRQEILDDLDLLEKDLPNIIYNTEEHSELKQKKTKLEDSIKSLKEQKGGEGGVSKTLEGDIKKLPELCKSYKALELDLKSKDREIEIYNVLNDAFNRTQERIRKNLSPNIETYFSWILPKITNDRYKKVIISEDFDIKAFSMEKNDFVDLGVLSGGTEDQLLISLRLAFAKALTPENAHLFLFLDEPISSFDETRRTSFLEFLRLLESSFQQIFLITHLTGLEDYVDNFIKISESIEGIPIVDYSWG